MHLSLSQYDGMTVPYRLAELKSDDFGDPGAKGCTRGQADCERSSYVHFQGDDSLFSKGSR